MDFLCACLRRKGYTKIDETEVETKPAEIVSARLDSEYDLENFRLKNTFSSMYRMISEWSLPKSRQINLFTLSEEEHEFLVNDVFPAEEGNRPPSPAYGSDDNFDDVVDEIIK